MSAALEQEAYTQDQSFLEYVQRLENFSEGRRAARIRLSLLQKSTRTQHNLRIARTTFGHLITRYKGAIFSLHNDDLVIICKDVTVADMDDFVLRLRYLFSADPFLASESQNSASFCEWFDLERDYTRFFALAMRNHEASLRPREDEAVAMTGPAPDAAAEPKAPSVTPLNPEQLVSISKAIAGADLSRMLSHQHIFSVAAGAKAKPVFQEIFTSIAKLQKALLPQVDFAANRWLFQELTRHLDRRVLTFFAEHPQNLPRGTFSLNLNISTLLAPEFLAFDEKANKSGRPSIVIELQLIDIFSDLGSYLFARDFLHERGYKICLDGANHLVLPFVDREKLGLDLVKILWGNDLQDQLNSAHGGQLRDTIKRVGLARTILCRCDSQQALVTGRALGINLYQGFYLSEQSDGALPEEAQTAVSAPTQAVPAAAAAAPEPAAPVPEAPAPQAPAPETPTAQAPASLSPAAENAETEELDLATPAQEASAEVHPAPEAAAEELPLEEPSAEEDLLEETLAAQVPSAQVAPAAEEAAATQIPAAEEGLAEAPYAEEFDDEMELDLQPAAALERLAAAEDPLPPVAPAPASQAPQQHPMSAGGLLFDDDEDDEDALDLGAPMAVAPQATAPGAPAEVEKEEESTPVSRDADAARVAREALRRARNGG